MKAAVAAASIAACIACASAQPVAQPVAVEPIAATVAVSTFDSVWSVVRNTYVDTVFVATHWTALRDTLRPRAALVTTRKGLGDLLVTTLDRIPDSHFYVIPEGSATTDESADTTGAGGTTGLSLRVAGDKGVVWRVEPGSPAAVAGIRAGETLEFIGAKSISQALHKVDVLPVMARQRAMSELLFSLNHLVSPAPGTVVRVKTTPIGGRTAEHSLIAVPVTGTVSVFGNLPPIAGRVVVQRMSTGGTGAGSCVGLIAFNIWLPALVPEIERGMDRVNDCAGVVVDLRGNPGGVGTMVMGFGGYFVDSAISLGTMRSRYLSLRFTMNPRRARTDGARVSPFHGPMAILVDQMSASTSEIFATGMQRIGRARVFGERSAGMALPAVMDRLPSGDVFVHAVADFTDPDGHRIEGAGVVPDEITPLSAGELSRGRDSALEAAMRWIKASSAVTPKSAN